jgi:hypothetical protein
MTATEEDILGWVREAKSRGKKYLMVITDTFDYENYPVYADEDTIGDFYREYGSRNMQKIEEIYNVNLPVVSINKRNRVFDWNPTMEKEKECKHYYFLCKECGIEVCDCREGYEETHPMESHRWDNDWD